VDYRAELTLIESMATLAERSHWPEALTAACAFRRYLAQRDVFVREQHASVLAMRRALGRKRTGTFARLLQRMRQQADAFALSLNAGRQAAAAMWNRTRNHPERSSNLRMLHHDKNQLQVLGKWLAAARRNPSRAWMANPLCGEWQLSYAVWNCAPAVQQVGVQQFQQGEWITLKACHTIEFSAAAAFRRSRLVRYHSVPVTPPGNAAGRWQLRFVLRGVGQVKISRVRLTNGFVTLSPGGMTRRWLQLGSPAPARGLPNLSRRWVITVPGLECA
jgi:hypothetical protein